MRKSTFLIKISLLFFSLLLWPLASFSSEGGNSVVISAPHYESFDDVSVPDLPLGWHKIVDNPTHTGALVQTLSTSTPYSPPYHVRIFSDTNTEANVMLITPLVENLTNLRIRFFARCNIATQVPNLIIGTMTDPQDATTFVPFDTIFGITELTNVYQRFIVNLNPVHTTNAHIAFRHGGAGTTTRSIFIDNFVLEHIPGGPIQLVNPSSWDYGRVVFNTVKPKEFIITNTGIGNLTITSGQISISGPNADRFILPTLPPSITLEPFQVAGLTVNFAPLTTGDHEATLHIADQSFPLTGEGFDPTITQVPHLQTFNDINAPDLALGWTKIVQTTSTGNIETVTTSGPVSPPNHVRFSNSVDANAQLILISPQITLNLNELRTRFYARELIAADNAIEVGVITNPSNMATYTALGTFDLTTTHQEFIFSFAEYTGTAAHVAFRAVTPGTVRSIFLDNFLLEAIPGEPIFHVSPQLKDFGPIQTGTSSDLQQFTITNHGEGLMAVNPQGISITGADAPQFVLTNLEEAVELAHGESAVISVAFAPEALGHKQATLLIDGNEVPLSGEGIDAVISVFPYYEDFSDTGGQIIPFGWIRSSSHWRVASTSHAGGQAPELRFLWNPSFTGKSMIRTPLINTSGFSQLKISFDHMVNNYGAPGSYTLKVVVIDGENHHTVVQWVDPSNIAAEHFWTILTAEEHGIGSENLRLGFIFDGISININDWNIDNLRLEEVPELYSVNFQIVEDSIEELPIEGALISFDTYIDDLLTDEDGMALIQLFDGTYNITVSSPGYQTKQISFTVDGQDMDVQIRMTDVLIAPNGLQITIDDQIPGNVLFSWQHPHATLGFVSFSVFLNEMDVASVNTGEYLFTGLETGQYTAGVQAVYSTGLSAVATIVFDIEVNLIPVVELPWNENFSGVTTGDIPQGWTRSHPNWGVRNTSNAGGQAPEMQFDWAPEFQGQANLRSPYINTTGFDELTLSFRNMVSNFSGPGIYDLKVVTIVGDQQHIVHQWQDPASIPAQLFSVNITEAHGVGSDSLRIAWIFDGNSADINWWNIDNISLNMAGEVYSLSFDVRDQDDQAIQDAVITFGGVSHDAGSYVFTDLNAGTYAYSVSRSGYFDVQGEAIITDSDLTKVVVMQKDQTGVITPDMLSVKVHPNPASGLVNVTSDKEITELRIINMSGQVVFKGYPAESAALINVSALNTGVYLLQVYTSAGIRTQRLQIAR